MKPKNFITHKAEAAMRLSRFLIITSCIIPLSIRAMHQRYADDLIAIEQSNNPSDEIKNRRENYKRYDLPQWLHAAARDGKEKLIVPLIQSNIFKGADDESKYPMDYALEQNNTNIIDALFKHNLIHCRVIKEGGLLSEEKISDAAMVRYISKLTALPKCSQKHLASAAASIIECCSNETIRECFFKGFLNPALSEAATPIDLRMGRYIQEKLAIALEKTIDPEAKKQSWEALPKKIELFKEQSSKGDLESNEKAEQYYNLLHHLYFFIKARNEFSNRGGSSASTAVIPESMAENIKNVISSHKSLNASQHTFLCAGAILHHLCFSMLEKDNPVFLVTETYLHMCVKTLPHTELESCLGLKISIADKKIKND
jgi:hypothetical protein